LKAYVPRRAAALPRPLDSAKRALNNSFRGGRQALRNSNDGQPNNGMHPTANSVALIRETPAIQRFVAAGDAER